MVKNSFCPDQSLAVCSFNFIKRASVALVIISIGFSNAAIAQVAPGYQIGSWSRFKQAAVSYTFDDNTSKQLTVALPLFDQYDYKITLFTVTGWGPNWNGLLNAANKGHEIASHTVSHPLLGTISVPDQDAQLKESQSIINGQIPNSKCVTLAYPSCIRGDLATIQKYYIAGRVCSNTLVPATPDDFYNISSFITGSEGPVKTAADFNSRVSSAKNSKSWCVFLGHGIDDDPGFSPTQSSELSSHLDYMNMNKADYWVETFGNVVKYIKERNAASLYESILNSDSIQVIVTDNLDNSIFNYPVTVRRVLPAGWQSPRVYKGDQLITSSVITESGITYVMFDVVPDQGPVYLANGNNLATSVASPFRRNGFNLYPNPSASAVTIETDGSFENAIFRISDVSGTDLNVPVHLSGNKAFANVSSLKTGTYNMIITRNGLVVQEKIIIAR